ncbi:uncharacterized protein LOC113596413 isoform X1 [Acinonyx jubatus]|uniref:Uncharacterized protein LOC113596413 isoform X1 n=1 Tax=Acinonyx jubatus TaxID=32536 RepID=A0ABM3PWP7_ACIJB|nr:uncharacterized protein LOC113596413 isoform X1 [Acinonyx jubatus]
MDRFWMTTGRVSLLEALVPCLVQAQPLAQRKPWLVGLGAALAALFLTFVFTVVYAVWCREARDRWAPFEPEPPPPLPNHRPPAPGSLSPLLPEPRRRQAGQGRGGGGVLGLRTDGASHNLTDFPPDYSPENEEASPKRVYPAPIAAASIHPCDRPPVPPPTHVAF